MKETTVGLHCFVLVYSPLGSSCITIGLVVQLKNAPEMMMQFSVKDLNVFYIMFKSKLLHNTRNSITTMH